MGECNRECLYCGKAVRAARGLNLHLSKCKVRLGVAPRKEPRRARDSDTSERDPSPDPHVVALTHDALGELDSFHSGLGGAGPGQVDAGRQPDALSEDAGSGTIPQRSGILSATTAARIETYFDVTGIKAGEPIPVPVRKSP